MIRIYPTVVFKNTELEKMLLEKKYQPLSLEKGVSMTARALIQLREAGIEILRAGLRSIKDESRIAGGCYHPQFRYMVESEIMRINMDGILSNHLFPEKVLIKVPPSLLQYALGFRKTNIRRLSKEGDRTVLIKPADIPENTIIVENRSYLLRGIL